jgi:hypothetical protein
MTSIDDEMNSFLRSYTAPGKSALLYGRNGCVSLFGNDDNRGLKVHLNIDGLVRLKRVFKPGSGLVSETFKRLTRHIL